MSSLPLRNISKQTIDERSRVFFDRYYTTPVNLKDNDIAAIVGFFKGRGFDDTSANAISITLLNQAKNDKVDVYSLLDTLQSYEGVRLSAVVAEILNYNRKRTSAIGFKKIKNKNKIETRNIIEGSPTNIVINTETQTNFSSTGFSFDIDSITWDGA